MATYLRPDTADQRLAAAAAAGVAAGVAVAVVALWLVVEFYRPRRLRLRMPLGMPPATVPGRIEKNWKPLDVLQEFCRTKLTDRSSNAMPLVATPVDDKAVTNGRYGWSAQSVRASSLGRRSRLSHRRWGTHQGPLSLRARLQKFETLFLHNRHGTVAKVDLCSPRQGAAQGQRARSAAISIKRFPMRRLDDALPPAERRSLG